MHSRLVEILAEKQREVAKLKTSGIPANGGNDLSRSYNFRGAISVPNRIGLIAEIKFASPSAGTIRKEADPISIGRVYEGGGAAAVSLLTDKRFFGGDLDQLPRLKRAISLPILRKDFIIDAIQLRESFLFGADAILLMTHIVRGYPSLEDSFRIVETMVDSGVDLMELQIPFSEPIADGPVIARANQRSLERGATVEACLNLAERIVREFDIPFLIMTYYNILSCYGVHDFISAIAGRGLQGAIVPDLPPEEGHDYLEAMQIHDLAPILIFSPATSDRRMKYLDSLGRGFIYCVARKGVTGADTNFSTKLSSYLVRCRKASHLPLAVGFGIKNRANVDFLRGKADIAVIGTETIRTVEEQGVAAVRGFIRGLR